MCSRGFVAPVDLAVPDYTGCRNAEVDLCIAPVVAALNGAGIRTVASCCGHGIRPGDIALEDGRELIIAQTYEIARHVEAAFPPLTDRRSES